MKIPAPKFITFYNGIKQIPDCRTLKEYMLYVERVRKYAGQSNITLNAAVERAVDECIKENILADFLRKNRAEAIHMSIFEYDEERESIPWKKSPIFPGWI